MFDVSGYSSTSEYFPDLHSTISKKKKSRNKRRFSDDQIRSLEVMFENETKLEPRQKVELAKDLGLQPRQVAIWFQNRRARWKSKQIEKDYNLLLANYNNLATQFESLNKENQSLLIQLQKLKNEMMEKPELENQSKIQETWNSTSTSYGESDCNKMDFVVHRSRSNYEGMISDEDGSIKFLGLEKEESELLKIVEPAAGDSNSLTSVDQDWGNLDSDDLINQPTQWWDFWS